MPSGKRPISSTAEDYARPGCIDYLTIHAELHDSDDVAVRVGIDLVSVSEIVEAVDRWGERYLKRVFTPSELGACSDLSESRRSRQLAACFAAKEAAIKVIADRTGDVHWQCVELTEDSLGGSTLELRGQALDSAVRHGITNLSVCVTYAHDHAVAVVLAEETQANSIETGRGAEERWTNGSAK